VWIDGVSRVMVDAGGGTFARFHEAGARLPDLQLLALSHFHPDHSAEVPALFWVQRQAPLVAGPSGNAGFPSVDEFMNGLIGATDAVFRVFGGRTAYTTTTVDVAADEPVEVFSDGHLTVRGIGVPHRDAPTVGYRVDVGDASVAFSSDQVGTNPAFTELVRDVDVLVVHFAGSEEEPRPTSGGHAKPSVWGQMASDARAGTLILSHLQERDLEGRIAHLRSRYSGPLTVAEDLLCVAVE